MRIIFDQATTTSAPNVQEFISRHAEYQHHHDPISTFDEWFTAGGEGPKVAVVTCADPRCIPERFLNLNMWEAVVLRNAGSNVKAALPSLIAIDSVVGLQEIMIINHTDCGALGFRDDSIKSTLYGRAPSMENEINAMKFGEITGLVHLP